MSTRPIHGWNFNNTDKDAFGSLDITRIGATFSTDAKLGSHALNLDGDDRATIPDDDDMSFGDSISDIPFSMSVWCKPTDITSFKFLTKRVEYSFTFDADDKLRMILFDGGITPVQRMDIISDNAYTSDEGSYHLYGVTYDGDSLDTSLKLYRDDKRITTTTVKGAQYTAMDNTSNNGEIGAYGGVVESNGLPDALYVWKNHVLTDGGVAEGVTAGGEWAELWNGGAGRELGKDKGISKKFLLINRHRRHLK